MTEKFIEYHTLLLYNKIMENRNSWGWWGMNQPTIDWQPVVCNHIWQDIETTETTIKQKCLVCWAERILNISN